MTGETANTGTTGTGAAGTGAAQGAAAQGGEQQQSQTTQQTQNNQEGGEQQQKSGLLYEAADDESPVFDHGAFVKRIETETKGRIKDADGLLKSYLEANSLVSKRVQELPPEALMQAIKSGDAEKTKAAVSAIASELGLLPVVPESYEKVPELIEQFSNGAMQFDEKITGDVIAKFKEKGFTQDQVETAFEIGIPMIVEQLAKNGPAVDVAAEQAKMQEWYGDKHTEVGTQTIKWARANLPTSLVNALGLSGEGVRFMHLISKHMQDSQPVGAGGGHEAGGGIDALRGQMHGILGELEKLGRTDPRRQDLDREYRKLAEQVTKLRQQQG